MGFFKDFFSPNPWKNYDPDWSFRNRVVNIVGSWDFSKLEALMKSGNMFDHDFFTSGRFNECPDHDKIDLFCPFIESWGRFLSDGGLTEESEFVSKMVDKLRSKVPQTEARQLPKWFSMLPHHLQPKKEKVNLLENLRQRLQLPDEAFIMGISVTPWAVVRTQEEALNQFRRTFPHYSERDLWRSVIFSRFEVKLKTPSPWDPPMDEILKKMESLDSIMKRINSWQDTLDYILEMDKMSFSNDPTGIQHEINRVLHA